jgi:tetratricopeptide (TPR) repeat protein
MKKTPTSRSTKKSDGDISVGESVDILSNAIAGIDFQVDADDFILYELNRMIEEERASFEDEEFRILIDEGIREHIEENLQVRSELAGKLRISTRTVDPKTRVVAERVIRALENTNYDLRNAGVVVRTYTAYLFERLQSLDGLATGEADVRTKIESWKTGGISAGSLIADLQKIGRPALGPIAELLTQSPEDRASAELSLAVLSHIRSSVSARVLAYVVSEPMLDEDLEARAYTALRSQWPLPRGYMLHSLHSHAHEDLPFRWFQLLIEAGETTSSELIFDEMRVHGKSPNYHEDLWALTSLLAHSHDPEIEDKVLEWINIPQIPEPVIPMLQEFLKDYRRPEKFKPGPEDPWARRAHLQEMNSQYIASSRLFEAGQIEEAQRALKKILKEEPDYPFAVMLTRLMKPNQ